MNDITAVFEHLVDKYNHNGSGYFFNSRGATGIVLCWVPWDHVCRWDQSPYHQQSGWSYNTLCFCTYDSPIVFVRPFYEAVDLSDPDSLDKLEDLINQRWHFND